MKDNRFSFRLDKSNEEFLNSLKEKHNISKNEMINIIINEYKNKFKKVDFLKKQKDYKYNKVVRIKLTDEEVSFFEKSMNEHNFSSLTKELRYRIVNSIYKDKLFSNLDMKELTNANNDINKIGRNLNQLVRVIKEKSDKKLIINEDGLKKLLENIFNGIKNINLIVSKSKQDLDNRI